MSPNPVVGWDFHDDAAVAAFDILGFKRIMSNATDLRTIAEKLSRLVKQARGTAEERTVFQFGGAQSSAEIRLVQASDTFIVYCQPSSSADVIQFLWNLQQLLFYAILDAFPLRGAITVGRVAAKPSEHLFIGPAILDARRLERIAEWAGAIVSQSLHQRLAELGLAGHLYPLLVSYVPPMKPQYADAVPHPCLCLNWLADAPNFISPDWVHTKFPEVNPEDAEYASVQGKVENTQTFMREVIGLAPFVGPANRRMVLESRGEKGRLIRFVLDR
jgi:hypothetical protein